MLTITVPPVELWNEETELFSTLKAETIQLEHSLISISKWESKWKKPFLDSDKDRSAEQTLDYIRCMTVTPHVNPTVYSRLSKDDLKTILDYINDPMTATWFQNDNKQKGKNNSEKVTSELIYYWMVTLQIPFECQKWHLNRLLTLIQVCNVKNSKPEKLSKKEFASKRAALNAARRKHLSSRG